MAWLRRSKAVRDEAPADSGGSRRAPTSGHLYADDPVDAAHDQLDRGRLAQQLARSIEAVAEQSDSAVVALVGPWGSGKSSLLLNIEEKLRAKEWYLARHNPWAYSSYDGAVAGFFAEIRGAVPDDIMGEDKRKIWGEWISRLAPMGSLGSVARLNASGALQSVAELVLGDRSPEALRKAAEEPLTRLRHPILVILDDLDRLQPDELLLTFKLVRLIGRLPNVYYLLAYDEQTLSDVLQHTQLIGRDAGRARQYLEKMVQVRLDIPPLLEEQQTALVNRAVDALCAAHSIELGPDSQQRLQSAWSECLIRYLDQPRATKRLFTQIDALWPEVHGEVDFVDFLLMTFLRTFERDVYELVVEHKAELLQGSWTMTTWHNENNGQRWERWRKLVADRGRPQHLDAITALLTQLFLQLRGARDNTTFSGAFHEDVRRRRGVDSAEFFDRYTQVGVPASDLADTAVSDAVVELRDGTDGPSLLNLRQWLEKDAAKVTSKLARIHDRAPLPTGPVLLLLGQSYIAASEQTAGFIGIPADRQALSLAERLLARESPADVLTHLRVLSTGSPSDLALATDLVRRAKRADASTTPPWLQDGVDTVSTAIEAFLRSASTESIESCPHIARFVYAFRDLRGRSSSHALFWDLLNHSAWRLDDLLASLVPIGQTSDGRRTWPSLGDLEAGSIDELLGLDQVLDALPDSGSAPADDNGGDRDVTFDGRRRHALLAVDQIRARRPAAEDPRGEV